MKDYRDGVLESGEGWDELSWALLFRNARILRRKLRKKKLALILYLLLQKDSLIKKKEKYELNPPDCAGNRSCRPRAWPGSRPGTTGSRWPYRLSAYTTPDRRRWAEGLITIQNDLIHGTKMINPIP